MVENRPQKAGKWSTEEHINEATSSVTCHCTNLPLKGQEKEHSATRCHIRIKSRIKLHNVFLSFLVLFFNLQGIWSLPDNRNLVTTVDSNRWDLFRNINLVENNDGDFRKLSSNTRNVEKSIKDIYNAGRLII